MIPHEAEWSVREKEPDLGMRPGEWWVMVETQGEGIYPKPEDQPQAKQIAANLN